MRIICVLTVEELRRAAIDFVEANFSDIDQETIKFTPMPDGTAKVEFEVKTA